MCEVMFLVLVSLFLVEGIVEDIPPFSPHVVLGEKWIKETLKTIQTVVDLLFEVVYMKQLQLQLYLLN